MRFTISVNELRAYLNDDMAPTLIDVRVPEAYAQGHLPGAINIPRDELAGSLGQIPADRPVVTYCNMHNPGSSGSEMAADLLREAGYHARVLKGGYPEWVESGAPVDRQAHDLPHDWPAPTDESRSPGIQPGPGRSV